MDANDLRELGQQFRVDSIRPAAVAKSGHPTSGMSAADLMAVLVANHLRYDYDSPKSPANDRLIFSKGHASTLYYAILRAVGAITDEELLTYRKFGSMLEGHPTPLIPWVDVATGSLGQGLPIGVGMGLAAKYLDRLPSRVWVLCGDSEMAEGSMWEAYEHASHYELDNLTAIIDVNRLGQRGETMIGWNTGVYVERARAFGWNAIEIDQGQRRQGGREQGRLARQAARRSRRGDRGARRGPQHPRRSRKAEAWRGAPIPGRAARAAALRARPRGGDAEGVRRGARGARVRSWRRGRT